MAGCTLQDCITQFFAAERIENYRCSNCWHNAAIGYLSAFAEDKVVSPLGDAICIHKIT